MKKIIYIPFFVIILIVIIFVCCNYTSPKLEEEDNPSLLGGWVFCDSSYTPLVNNDHTNDYSMMHIEEEKMFFGYLSSTNEDFYYYYTSPVSFAYTSDTHWGYTSGSLWTYHYTSSQYAVSYRLTDEKIRITYTSPSGYSYYYDTLFDLSNSDTRAIIYYGYSSGAGYSVTSSAAYFKKIDDYNNKGLSPTTRK